MASSVLSAFQKTTMARRGRQHDTYEILILDSKLKQLKQKKKKERNCKKRKVKKKEEKKTGFSIKDIGQRIHLNQVQMKHSPGNRTQIRYKLYECARPAGQLRARHRNGAGASLKQTHESSTFEKSPRADARVSAIRTSWEELQDRKVFLPVIDK